MAISKVARAVTGRRVPWWVWLLSTKAVIIGVLVVVCGMAIVGAVGVGGQRRMPQAAALQHRLRSSR